VKIAVIATLAALILGAGPSARADESLVLFVSAESPVARLETIEVRELFLGLTVIRNERTLRALDNYSDSRVHEVFLQNVIAMPESAYVRRLLLITLQQGGRRPGVYNSKTELLNAVAADPAAVSIAWAKDVANDRRFKILRVLWRD
jgi:hypothetical protein